MNVRNVDDKGKTIENIDWSIWKREWIEEVYDNITGELIEIVGHCVRIPDDEINQNRLKKMLKEQETLLEQIQRRSVLRTLDDVDAFSVRLLYDKWNKNTEYLVNDRIMFENKFYKCLSDHTSDDTLKPTLANYLWVEISDPNVEWPEWKQPLGYADAYKKGDKVLFKGKKYISLIDSNTYSPETYPAGWEEVI